MLYGASQFTEDIDLWIEPVGANLRSFLRALADVGAVVYKATPPPTLPNLRKGHGFHFLIHPDIYIDVMGKPPRVGGFASAWRRVRPIHTEWGELPVVSPEDLVLLKRTNRPSDYEAISNLVRMRTQESQEDRSVLRWALANTFDVLHLVELALEWACRPGSWPRRPAVRALLPLAVGTRKVSAARRRKAGELLALEMSRLQDSGRRYWAPMIQDLKRLRSAGKLLRQGMPVSDLL